MTHARIAIIGAGWWSTYTHIPALEEHPAAELVALCDTDAAKLHAAATAYDIPQIYTDVETMLAHEQLDGAVVVTSHASHYAVAKACLEAGLHVMIEKPMTLFAREAKELVDLAGDRGRELLIGYPFNYAPFVRHAKAVIDSGVLGEIEYIHCLYSSNVIELFRGNDAGTAKAVHGPGDVYSDPLRSGGGHGHLQITHGAGILFFVSGLRVSRVHALMHKRGLAVDVARWARWAARAIWAGATVPSAMCRSTANTAGWISTPSRARRTSTATPRRWLPSRPPRPIPIASTAVSPPRKTWPTSACSARPTAAPARWAGAWSNC